ncbi:Hsp20 family protein [Pseudodesulfovibrio sp. JC047]|uniref:Hsp20/alpha crystallin family protein n=1 Tax=Pseudodesulfovibrio sp. JC047 TaxID=2683199 RepID=UPI0013D4371F|nr:Hsp20/alpha crystallin family protein [Pseudodesulfovibrio sp. JC047]NDV18170.1 Hsp20 family protein [Pseudodesulfovibrio sp. JC047]
MVLDFNTLYNFPTRFDRVFEEFLRSPMRDDHRLAYPPLNLSNDENTVYVRAEVPGMSVDDIELTLTDKTLVIKGERKAPQGKYYRQERPSGVFNRVVNMAIPVDRDAVTASMKNGILTITLPKSAAVKPKNISIDVR